MGLDIYFYHTKREEIGYFRNYGFASGFFEEAKGENLNCRHCEVTEEEARELLARCERVLTDRTLAPELLPAAEYGRDYFMAVLDMEFFLRDTLLPGIQRAEIDGFEESVELYMSY